MADKTDKIIIRPAREDDIPRVLELLGQICEHHRAGRPDLFRSGTKYSCGELLAIFEDENTPVLVAECREGKQDATDVSDRCVAYVAGYVFCVIKRVAANPVMRDRITLYIDDLCVDENIRGRGIGRRLLEAAKALANDIGAYNIDLNVWEFNAGAIRFYESCGMKPSRRHMELLLSPDGDKG